MARRPTEDESAPAADRTDERKKRDFDARLKNARREAGLDKPPEPVPPLSLAGYAMRLATELVAGIIVGGGLGWVIDRAAHTAPFAFIACLLLGFLGGMLNVMRAVKKLNKQQASAVPAQPVKDDDED